jgi:hypothetical protein
MPFRALAAAMVIVLALAAAGLEPAFADGLIHELRIGVLAHDVPDLWSGFREEQAAADINLEAVLSPAMPFLWGAIRPAVGGTINTRGDTSHAYVDARWQIEGPSGLFFGVGLGAAVHDGETTEIVDGKKALGSRVLFHIPAEIGLHLDAHNSISAYFEHTSNANTGTYNEGLDRIGVRYGYRF